MVFRTTIDARDDEVAISVARSDEPLGSGDLVDLVGEALGPGAELIVIPTDALDPAFFELRSGLAGEVVQKCVMYGLRLVIVGPLPDAARASRAFRAFVSESNRGSQVRFALDDVSPRQASGGSSG
jgi:hypothetical protein